MARRTRTGSAIPFSDPQRDAQLLQVAVGQVGQYVEVDCIFGEQRGVAVESVSA
ncbi:MAG: hypothetical protein ACE5Q3_03135 [Alphaproteobacteria bacterium]